MEREWPWALPSRPCSQSLRAQSPPDDENKVHFEIMPYLVAAGMGGDVTVKGNDASFSQDPGDILGKLQAGCMGRTRQIRQVVRRA